MFIGEIFKKYTYFSLNYSLICFLCYYLIGWPQFVVYFQCCQIAYSACLEKSKTVCDTDWDDSLEMYKLEFCVLVLGDVVGDGP